MTCVSITSSIHLSSFESFSRVKSLIAGVMSMFLPVMSSFIRVSGIGHPAIGRGGDPQLSPVLGDGAPRHLDPVSFFEELHDRGIRERMAAVLPLDDLLD